MKTYQIACQGEVHEIGIDDDGDFVLLNHDVDEERVLADMGYEPPPCVALMMQIDEGRENDALIRAAREGHLGVVGLLLDHGADIHAGNDLKHRADIHARDDLALTFAARYGHSGVVKLLLEHGADVHAGVDQALRMAAEDGHRDVVKILLEHGDDVHAVDDHALKWASRNNHRGVVKLLETWIEEHG